MEEKVMYLIECKLGSCGLGFDQVYNIGVTESKEAAERVMEEGLRLYDKIVGRLLPNTWEEYEKRGKSFDNVCTKAVELLVATYHDRFPSIPVDAHIDGHPVTGYDVSFRITEVPVI